MCVGWASGISFSPFSAPCRQVLSPSSDCDLNGISFPLQVKSGKDDNALMQQLGEYLTDNGAVLQDYFRQADKDKSGEATVNIESFMSCRTCSDMT